MATDDKMETHKRHREAAIPVQEAHLDLANTPISIIVLISV